MEGQWGQGGTIKGLDKDSDDFLHDPLSSDTFLRESDIILNESLSRIYYSLNNMSRSTTNFLKRKEFATYLFTNTHRVRDCICHSNSIEAITNYGNISVEFFFDI